MFKPLARLFVAVGSASLALTPIAAQAGTRAGDNQTVYTAEAAQPGIGRNADGERLTGSVFEIFIALYVIAWTTGFIIVATDDDDDDFAQSPGV